jgi:hypothetical protein
LSFFTKKVSFFLSPKRLRGALLVVLGLENLDAAHGADALLVGALLAVVGAHLKDKE